MKVDTAFLRVATAVMLLVISGCNTAKDTASDEVNQIKELKGQLQSLQAEVKGVQTRIPPIELVIATTQCNGNSCVCIQKYDQLSTPQMTIRQGDVVIWAFPDLSDVTVQFPQNHTPFGKTASFTGKDGAVTSTQADGSPDTYYYDTNGLKWGNKFCNNAGTLGIIMM